MRFFVGSSHSWCNFPVAGWEEHEWRQWGIMLKKMLGIIRIKSMAALRMKCGEPELLLKDWILGRQGRRGWRADFFDIGVMMTAPDAAIGSPVLSKLDATRNRVVRAQVSLWWNCWKLSKILNIFTENRRNSRKRNEGNWFFFRQQEISCSEIFA